MEQFLRERLRMVSIAELKRYEAFEEAKVARLLKAICSTAAFLNPLSVIREMVVIDGTNRLEALRRLEAKHVPCVVYDYAEIELLGNVHYINDGVTTRLSEFSRKVGQRVEFAPRSPQDILAAAASGQLIPNGETFHRVRQTVIRLPIPLSALTSDMPFDLAASIERRIASGQIRCYQSGVYVCDEWPDAG